MPAEEIVALMSREDEKVVAAVRSAMPGIARAAELVSDVVKRGGRVFYQGAGTSGRIAVLDAAEWTPTFGIEPDRVVALIAGGDKALRHSVEGAEDRADHGAADLRTNGFSDSDLLIGVSASGSTPYVLGGFAYAGEVGAKSVAVTCNPGSAFHSAADAVIEIVVGPEVITGSTRLKAGTAQKMVLNMISTAAMVLSNETYGNLMVGLTAVNAKLTKRAVSMIREVSGVSAADARSALAEADGSIKVALLSTSLQTSPDESRHLLERFDGSLRAAMAAARTGARFPREQRGAEGAFSSRQGSHDPASGDQPAD